MIFVGFFALALLVMLLLMFGLLALLIANIIPVMLAILGAVAIGAFIGGGTPSTATTALIALVLYLAWRSTNQRKLARRRRNRLYDVEATASHVAPPAVDSPDSTLDTAFAALAEHADWAGSRLAVAQQSCRLFLVLADRMPYDMEAGGLAVRIRKRIPEHVAECITHCEAATASERRVILDETVSTLEKVGAEADRHRSRMMGPAASEMDIQRRHLLRRSDDGLFESP